MFNNIHFAQPYYLYFLLVIPLSAAWYWFNHLKSNPEIKISATDGFISRKKTLRQYFYHGLFILRMLAVALLIVALARPQSSSSREDVSIEGIDIVISMDISGTMLSEDFRPNRLEASKNVAIKFIESRPNDRIGLVVFSGESFTQCPLTSDHSVLINLFKDVKNGIIEDGTAMGDGLATAVNRIKKSKAVSKVIILLTDGINNTGNISPLSAAEMAKMFGIRVYAIGVGTMGTAPYPARDYFGRPVYVNVKVDIDEPILKQIAAMTNGKYFRATNNKKLEAIYSEIDKMEKSKIDVMEFRRKKEEFLPLALLACIFIIAEILLRNIVLKNMP